MSDSYSYIQSLRNMCLRDSVVQQLYDGELNWADIPDDDEPLVLDNYKEYIERTQMNVKPLKKNISKWTGNSQKYLFPSLSHSMETQTEKCETNHSETQTDFDELEFGLAIFVHSLLHTIPSIQISNQLIEDDTQINPPSPIISTASPIPSNTLFLKNLPSDLTDNEIKEIFKVYGMIREISIKRVMDPNDKMKVLICKFAHIRFYSVESAKKAYGKLNGHLQIRKKKIGIEFAK